MKVTLLHFGLLAMLASPAAAFSAQDADESALEALDQAIPKPLPQKIEPAGSAELRDAVRRIAQSPTDSYALTDAGYAAIKLGDYDAAFNFFSKANLLRPADARIKAGMGISQVRRENPFEALSLFDEATRLGASERNFALDRALAFDLLGNFDRAERDYQLATSFGGGDEVELRHAISLSLSGRRDEADRMLIPMLQKDNPDAWRARAMMLAARGESREAGKIALGFLSDSEARRMDGYFRNMPRLTVAQQAAAMHFGHFPIGSEIGEDSGSVRSLAAATGARPVPQGGDSRLIPSGEPLGAKPVATAKVDKTKKKGKGSDSRAATSSAQQTIDAAARPKVQTVSASRAPNPEAARVPVRIALPSLAKPQPSVTTTTSSSSSAAELPAIGPAVSGAPIDEPAQAVFEPKPVVIEPTPTPAPAEESRITVIELPPSTPYRSEPQGPGFDSLPSEQPAIAMSQPPAETLTQPAPAVVDSTPEPIPAAAVPVTEKTFDLGALVASIEVPDDEKKPSVAPVDLKKIKPVAAKPDSVAVKTDTPAKGAKPAAAAPRIWVQIATGADATGLGYDYKRMAKKNAALFANREGWTATWGKTRRLLVGPFADLKAAKKWEADFRKGGGEGFVWQSDKTAQIDKLKVK